MDYIMGVYNFFQSPTGAGVLLALLSTSEALAAIPGVKANSIYQLISGLLEKVVKRPAVV